MDDCGEGFDSSDGIDESEALMDGFDACAMLSFEGLESCEVKSGVAAEAIESATPFTVGEGEGELNELIAREIDDYERMLDDVNSNYDPFDRESPYNVNCGACAIACEERLSGRNPEAVAGTHNIGTMDEMNAATGRVQMSMSPYEIIEYAERQGPGYHGVVGFDWQGTHDGHWINVGVSPSNHVYSLDAQCGQAMLFSEYAETYAKNGTNWDLSR